MIRRVRLLLACCTGLAALGAALPASGQDPPPVPFGQGTHALRAILKQKLNATPLRRDEFEDKLAGGEASRLLLVVLGDSRYLNEWTQQKLRSFVRDGGALLVATDQPTGRTLTDAFGVRVTGDFLQVDEGSALGYRKLADCPLIFKMADHPMFATVGQIATNRPSDVVFGRTMPKEWSLVSLAWFPPEAHLEKSNPALERGRGQGYRFAVGGDIHAGRVLVLSDHSVFINDMMLQVDNDNFFFARNCFDWLTDSGKRNQVLFIEDGRVVTDFNISFKETPPLPFRLPSEGALIEKGNELLAGLDVAGGLNRMINDRIPGAPPDANGEIDPVRDAERKRENIFLLAVLLLSGLLGVYGFYRLTQARQRLDGAEPRLAACLAAPGNTPTLIERRNQHLSRQNNYWETAHQLARQCFDSLIIGDERTGGRRPARGAAPHINIRAGWWRRRALKRQAVRLWRLASGQVPEKVTAEDFRRLQEELREVRSALDDGTLRLSVPAERRP
jgi:hypothetical protein